MTPPTPPSDDDGHVAAADRATSRASTVAACLRSLHTGTDATSTSVGRKSNAIAATNSIATKPDRACAGRLIAEPPAALRREGETPTRACLRRTTGDRRRHQ